MHAHKGLSKWGRKQALRGNLSKKPLNESKNRGIAQRKPLESEGYVVSTQAVE